MEGGKVMKEEKYSKSFLFFTHILLSAILVFFTFMWTLNYSKNLLVGYIVSTLVLLIYFFVVKKSVALFISNRVGASYFLTISAFISLAFAEMVNCSNSMNWMH
jgi:hypothetical protein